MKQLKTDSHRILFYALMLFIFGTLMYIVSELGEGLQGEGVLSATENAPRTLSEGFVLFLDTLLHHIESPFALLLVQIITILLTCRLFGWLFQKMGQPMVIGEVVAGIVLGPSVVGSLFPEFFAWLFRTESLVHINTLSQFGLILFMYTIGMELDLTEVRKRMKDTVLISHAGTILPFFCGMVLAYFVYDKYAYETTPFLPFALFIGISMSVTAFPILARIIQEKRLTKSRLGTITLASAANGDITAWCLLAAIMAIAQAGSMLSAVFNILFTAVFLLFMFLVVRPFLRAIGQVYHNKEVVGKGMIAFMFLFLIASAYLTEILGLHALFGAFMAGVVMPENAKFRHLMTEKVEDVSLSLFLPLFFVSTGLRTEIGLLNSPELWRLCFWFILVAVASKMVGAYVPARFLGESRKDSLYIGALMNTRGLTELIILSIGYEMRVLSPEIFVILVLMTLITTLTTSPILSLIKLIYHAKERYQQRTVVQQKFGVFNVLLSFGRAKSGEVLLGVAHQMFAANSNELNITALHLTIGNNMNPLRTDNFEEISFAPILFGAQRLNVPLQTRYELSSDASKDICRIANEESFDFLLVGAGISMSDLPNDVASNRFRSTLFSNKLLKRFRYTESWFYPGALLKDKTKEFIEGCSCPVGVFVNRNFEKASQIVVYQDTEDDAYLVPYAEKLAQSSKGKISVLKANDLNSQRLTKYNFMLVSYESWNRISETHKETLQLMPSTLILSKGNSDKTKK